MSMPVSVFADDDELFDPDVLKMPESPVHRTACDVIGLAAVDLLGPDHEIFRDMNWYPTDGGNAIAPDVFVLPAGALSSAVGPGDRHPKSYRQDQTGGPNPLVSIEVPSFRDTYVGLMAKIRRCQRLGVVVYLVSAEGDLLVLRFDPSTEAPEPWTRRPIPELGGLAIEFDDGVMTVVMPDGTRAATDHELLTARSQAAAEAEAEVEALRQKLRDHGIDPA